MDQQDSAPGWNADGPAGTDTSEYIEFWGTNGDRGNQGYVGNLAFYHDDNWDTDPPSA